MCIRDRADTGYFNQRMPQALPPQTQDIGPFWAVNLELLDRLRPDLIFLGAPSLFMTPLLKDIAPVEVVAEGDSGGRSAKGQQGSGEGALQGGGKECASVHAMSPRRKVIRQGRLSQKSTVRRPITVRRSP